MRTRRLIVSTPEGERELLFIGRLTAGRAPECDISIADTKISRRHAEFDASGPMPRVVDLGSRNGILVNGRKVGTADLVPGDVVTIGDALVRFEEVLAAPAPASPPSLSQTDDRTAVLSPLGLGVAPPAADMAAPEPPPADPEPPSVTAEPGSDRTIVLPPPVANAPPAASASSMPKAPAAAVPSAPSAPSAPAVPGPAAATSAPPVAATAVVAPAPAVPTPVAPAAGGTMTGAALRAPRMSWGGMVSISLVLLGGLAVLVGALPLMSASGSALEALSQRQARTLAGWLAAGVDPEATPVVDAGVLETVLSQPGVEEALVLDRRSGRAVAPASASGRAYATLPGMGAQWRDLTSPEVGRQDVFADAFIPTGGGQYVVWVRYQRVTTDDAGLAIMVALLATLLFALITAVLIKRHTRATLQHFTRQVELAVSGAPAKVMQGTLVPGLERLPGVVTYLLERRTSTASDGFDMDPAGAASPGGASSTVPDGPAWLEVTPSLAVAATSRHAPAQGTQSWSTAVGRHLLDVIDDGALRNAIVQGLGALGMQAGAETVAPLPSGDQIGLRRESTGHVRVTFAAR